MRKYEGMDLVVTTCCSMYTSGVAKLTDTPSLIHQGWPNLLTFQATSNTLCVKSDAIPLISRLVSCNIYAQPFTTSTPPDNCKSEGKASMVTSAVNVSWSTLCHYFVA